MRSEGALFGKDGRQHARVGLYAAGEAHQVAEAVKADVQVDGSAQNHQQIRIGDRARPGQPVAAGQLRIEPLEIGTHMPAGVFRQHPGQGFLLEKKRGLEDRQERLVRVGVEEPQRITSARPRGVPSPSSSASGWRSAR
jgi:hypothetical protein